MEYQEIADATGNLIASKIANKVTKVSRSSRENNLETIINKYDKEKPNERYISSEERQKIIDNLKLI